MGNDFIIQFHEDLAKWLSAQLHTQSEKMLWRDIDVSRAIFNYLWYSHLELRESYIRSALCCNSHYFNNITINIPPSQTNNSDLILNDLKYNLSGKILSRYKDYILIYADNLRHIHYLLPLISHLTKSSQKIILLTRCSELPSELQNDNIVLLFFKPIISKAIITSGLVKIDPQLPIFIHTLFCYIHWLSPKLMICCDGCQTQYQLAAIYCRQCNIPAICLQFGWPGYIHYGFRELPYSHFLTWGKKFSNTLEKFSLSTKFHSVGRLGYINPNGSHDAITFFMQAPIFVSSTEYYTRFLNLINIIGVRYPSKKIIIRSHPEISIDEKIIYLAKIHSNIIMDENKDVEDTYRETHIAVSLYSSCLVESVAFGCIPLMFNPTYGFEYPLLPETHIAHTEDEFIMLITHFIEYREVNNISSSIQGSDINCINNYYCPLKILSD